MSFLFHFLKCLNYLLFIFFNLILNWFGWFSLISMRRKQGTQSFLDSTLFQGQSLMPRTEREFRQLQSAIIILIVFFWPLLCLLFLLSFPVSLQVTCLKYSQCLVSLPSSDGDSHLEGRIRLIQHTLGTIRYTTGVSGRMLPLLVIFTAKVSYLKLKQSSLVNETLNCQCLLSGARSFVGSFMRDCVIW